MNNIDSKRTKYLVIGVIAMLFAGVIYAWSILKAPLSEEFGWGPSELAVNFTITMCCFCMGGFLGGKIAAKFGSGFAIIGGGLTAGSGFAFSSLTGGSLGMLYLTYGVLAGLGIGVVYVVIISTVSAWYPDKKGLCSGFLMMGFGCSTLIIGNIADKLMNGLGWRPAYVILGALLAAVIVFSGIILKTPGEKDDLPTASKNESSAAEESENYTTAEMLRRSSFWRAFICIVFLAAVGNTVISFARDLALSLNASQSLATSLVGVLSVANGFGRILTGMMFDKLGRRKSMLTANIITISAAMILLVAVKTGSLGLGIAGLCLTGISYGSCPTFTSVVTSAFYGTKNFSSNFSVMNFNLMGASLIATVSGVLLKNSGGYLGPFTLLLVLAVLAMILNLSLKKA